MNALIETMIAMAMQLVQILTAVTCANATGHLLVMAEIAQVSSIHNINSKHFEVALSGPSLSRQTLNIRIGSRLTWQYSNSFGER